MVADTAQEGKGTFEPPFVKVVEKQAADTPWFVTVLQEEVLVAPALAAGINFRPERLAGGPRSAVPVDAVLLEAVVGRQIETAAEPPHRLNLIPPGYKETEVGVRGGDIGIAGMGYYRYTGGLEAAAGQFRPLRRSRGRQSLRGANRPPLYFNIFKRLSKQSY